MKFNLHIDNIVLSGVDLNGADQRKLKSAVVAELRRQLLTVGGQSLTQVNVNHKNLNGGAFTLGSSTNPNRMGRHIGKAVFRSIQQ